ncbi:protein translocase subunit yajC [Fontimonas thermophila]|uniref:Sec translocon accessory complex subunit YajC n=1 Tax=Fontimonas thermophila TaxID=1076937 RepID=A0A1I2ILF0_9GAMM|nr:preprotein translocase subunit YajC [Fontimonas thermophila]SFF42473.1 protein translocase subunit yajC [Fontimonas thermophila]
MTVLDILISPAYAQAATPQQPSVLMQFLPLILLVIVFYFLLIRPQMKRNREHREMLSKIAKGDEVVTAGGIAGKVVGIGEAYVSIEVADNVAIKVQKGSISSVLPKGTLKTL